MSEGCQCKWHKWYNEYKIQIENIPTESRKFFETMADSLTIAQDDLDYANAIINGQWIDADKVIAFRRKKIAEKKLPRVVK